jgi:iron-sulfur cluster repair protein YtfE (RIC family)
MRTTIETFHAHHRELLAALDRHLGDVARDPGGADLPALRSLLTDELVPHARGEERHLYTAVEEILKVRGQSTATMSIDHEAIEGYVEAIAEAIDAADYDSLPRLLQRMDAILRLHFEKEERVYLPLMAESLSEEQQTQVLEALESEPVRD